MEVGGYRLVKRLGFGGMSTVYEAEDESGTRVALKLLHPSLADAAGRERLAREVQMLQKVTGPFVAEVLDAETEGPDAFLVTELIDGPTLEQDVVDQGIYEGDDLAMLGEELGEAVRSIHRQGVLHRDLKPSNVMIGQAGPVLIDFGIAQLGDDSRLTAPGLVAQTPGYCDPRVLSGADPDEEADWWALAAVLAYAATGRPPFGRGGAPAILRRVLDGEADLAGLDEPKARAFAAALAPRRRISIDTLLAVLSAPELADELLPEWAGAALAATARTQGGGPSGVFTARAAGEPGGDVFARAGRTAPTQALAAADSQATETLGVALEGMQADRQETELFAPAGADAAATTTMPHAQPPAAPGLAPRPGSYRAATEPTRAYPVVETPPPGPNPAYAPPGQGDAAVAPSQAAMPGEPAVAENPAAAVVGYDAAGNPVHADGVTSPVPAWAQTPKPARWLVFLVGLLFAAAGGLWPVGVFAVFALIHVFLGTHGRLSGELRLRRLRRGGKYAHDVAGTVARAPWALLRAVFSTFLAVLAGSLTGALVAWLGLQFWDSEPLVGVPQVAGTIASVFVAMSVAWFGPFCRPAREGARISARVFAPSAGYAAFWSVALAAAIAVFGMLAASGSGVSLETVTQVSPSAIGEQLRQWLEGLTQQA